MINLESVVGLSVLKTPFGFMPKVMMEDLEVISDISDYDTAIEFLEPFKVLLGLDVIDESIGGMDLAMEYAWS